MSISLVSDNYFKTETYPSMYLQILLIIFFILGPYCLMSLRGNNLTAIVR